MNPVIQKILWVLLVVAVIFGTVWQFYPLHDAQARMLNLPLIGNDFKGKNVPLNDFEKDFFKKINVVKRVYFIDQTWFSVILLDGTHDRHLVHDPAFCFRGSGFTILNQKYFPLKNGQANVATLLKGSERIEALYWYSDGKNEYTSPWKYWWQTTLRRVTLGRSGPEPVLIILQPLGISKPNWENVIKDFQPILEV